MAKISNTLSYPNQSPIEGADYLIGTAANSTPIDKQTKTFTIQDIANFIIDSAFDGVSYRLPIFTAPGAGQESLLLVNSLFYQDTASLGGKPAEVLGTTVYLNNGAGVGSLEIAQNLTVGGNSSLQGNLSVVGTTTLSGNIKLLGPVYDANDQVGNNEQVLVSDGNGNVTWQNFQGSGLEFQGAWDARTAAQGGAAGNGGNPDLLLVQLIPGNTGKYWVVSTAGSVALPTTGGGTITDWEPGDWAIVSEDDAGNVFWDKIDNSSVLTGQGTPGNVAIWTAPRELGDAPIVINPIPGGTSLAFNATATHTIVGTTDSNAFGTNQRITANYAISSGEDNDNAGQSSIVVGSNIDSSAEGGAVFGAGHQVAATAQGSLVGGDTNQVSAANAFAVGNQNIVSGASSAGFGEGNEVSGNASIVSGDSSEVSGDYSFGIGENLVVSAESSISSGSGNTVAGDYSIAVGENILIDASAALSIAIGQDHQLDSGFNAVFGNSNTVATGTENIVAGASHNVTGAQSAVFGSLNVVSSTSGIVSGGSNTVSGLSSASFGTSLTNEGTASLAVGSANSVTNPAKFAVVGGENSSVSNTHSTAIGDTVAVSGIASIGAGKDVTIAGDYAVAIGREARADKTNGVAIGHKVESLDNFDVAIGDGAIAQGTNSVSIGFGTNATGIKSMSLVDNSVASGEAALAAGRQAAAAGDASVAIGYQASTSGARSVAVGDEAEAQGESSAAFGYKALATGKESTAIGPGSNANGEGSIAMGSGSSANGQYSVAIGSDNDVIEDGGLGNVAIGHNNKVNDIAVAQPGDGNFALGNSNTITGSVGAIGEGNSWLISAGSKQKKAIVIGNDNEKSVGPKGGGMIVLGNSLNYFTQDNAIYIGGTNRTSFYSNVKPAPSNLSKEVVRIVDSGTRIGNALLVQDIVDAGSNCPPASAIIGPYAGNHSIDSTSVGCVSIGIRNNIVAGVGSAILGVENNANFTNSTDTSRSHIIGYQNTMTDCYSSIIVGGQSDITTNNNAFSLGFSNTLAGRDSMFAFGENNTGPNGAQDRNSFMIGAQLQGSDKTMNLGFRNNVAEYPTPQRSLGLGDVAFSVSVGLNVNTDSNALLITEGGINGGAPSVPQIPRVILPTVPTFSASNDAAADALGVPEGGLYQNDGVIQINRGGGSAVNPIGGSYSPIGAAFNWLNVAPSGYFNFINGNLTAIPFNTQVYSVGGIVFNPTPATCEFIVPSTGAYRISLNLHFFDLFGDIDMLAGVYNSGGGPVVAGIIDQKDVTGNTDQNFFGQIVVELTAGNSYEFRALFSGGSGQSPFPSDTNNLYTSFEIARVF